jgi:uncharacterized protein (TIGR03435 family)
MDLQTALILTDSNIVKVAATLHFGHKMTSARACHAEPMGRKESFTPGAHSFVEEKGGHRCKGHGRQSFIVATVRQIPSTLGTFGAYIDQMSARLSLLIPVAGGLWAQPAFEVASVKATNPNSTDSIGIHTYPGGRISITKFTLKMLIEQIYGLQRFQISGGERWTSEDRWDIVAKPPDSSIASKFMPPTEKTRPIPEQLQMLKALLADRFQLKFRVETKEGPAYALQPGPKGAKLTPAKDHEAYSVVSAGMTGKPDRPEFMEGENASMALLADRLSKHFGRPVLDQTGIPGNFDFHFSYAGDDAPSASGPSLAIALEEVLGLKLVAIRAPTQTYVIEHAEKPAAN